MKKVTSRARHLALKPCVKTLGASLALLLAGGGTAGALYTPSQLTFTEMGTRQLPDLLAVPTGGSDFSIDPGWVPRGAGSARPPAFNVTGGELSLSYTGSAASAYGWLRTGIAARPWTTLIADVTQVSAKTGTVSSIDLGYLNSATGGYLNVLFSLGQGRAFLNFASQGGAVNTSMIPGGVSVANLPTTNFRLGMVLTEQWVYILLDRKAGGGWEILGQARLPDTFMVGQESTLSGWEAIVGGAVSQEAAPTRITAFNVGTFGGFGLRDPNLVTWDDGSPYLTRADGSAYTPGLGSDPISAYLTLTQGSEYYAQQGVYRLDLTTLKLTPVSHLYWREAGRVYSHNAGHLIRRRRENDWLALVSTWGEEMTSPVHIVRAMSGANLLSGTHVLDYTPLNIPTNTAVYDPTLRREGGVWRLAYSETDTTPNWTTFGARIASSPDLKTWTVTASNNDAGRHEGQKWARIGNQWYVLDVADDVGGGEYRVLDAGLRRVGVLNAPWIGGPEILPHPMVFSVPVGLKERYLMVSFDGATVGGKIGTRGKVVVFEASQQRGGHEFAYTVTP